MSEWERESLEQCVFSIQNAKKERKSDGDGERGAKVSLENGMHVHTHEQAAQSYPNEWVLCGVYTISNIQKRSGSKTSACFVQQ